jgi:uncharacterized damage-inducible protein DinB
MTEIQRIVGQMKAAFEGGAWHGPAVLEVLQDVHPLMAENKYSVMGAHSIWELVGHMTATADIVRRRIEGESAGLKDEEFWPEVPEATEENWRGAIAQLKRKEEDLWLAVTSFPESKLDDKLMAAGTSSAYANFHGHIQHNLYHAGQIALLKKGYSEIPF